MDDRFPDYTDGFSPQMAVAGSSTGDVLPDDIRTGRRKPPVNDPNNPAYNRLRSAEQLHRYQDDVYRPGNYGIMQEKPAWPVIPDKVQDKAPTRFTSASSGTDNLMTRPWPRPRNAADVDPNIPLHLSMADHRRDYPIMLMQPRGGVGINTIRTTPAPWDANLYVPPEPPSDVPDQSLFGPKKWGL